MSSNNWIYIGADINRKTWSKIGRTTVGLQTRHVSSQNPGYFIYTAYNIMRDDVRDIESKLLEHLEYKCGYERQTHLSTGSKSECFSINPYEMEQVVESFLMACYPLSVEFDPLYGGISRIQCEDSVYKTFKPQVGFSDPELDQWVYSLALPLPQNLGMSKDKYFTGNQTKHEEDLSNGHFFDFATGMQGYRDEDGNIYWH